VSDGSVPGPSALPSPPPPSGPRLPGKTGLSVVAAVVIVLIFLFSLVLLGAFGTASNGPGGAAVSFSSARNTGSQAAAPHGTWDLFAAIGLDLANATNLPINLTSLANCTVTSFSGTIPSSLSIPSFDGNLTSGVATTWLLEFAEPSTGALLIVVVSGGVTSLVIEESGHGCSFGSQSAQVSNHTVDSTVAASAVAAAGGAAFVKAHPTGVSLEMVLTPSFLNGSFVSPEWAFFYSTCSLPLGEGGSSSSGAAFYAAVNATTGELVPGSASTESCGSSPPPPPTNTIGNALVPRSVTLYRGAGTGGTLASQGCISGDYCYSVAIANVSENLTPGDFEMEVTGWGSNASAPPAIGFAVLDATGQVVVSANGAVEIVWNSGVGNSNTLLTNTMTFSVDMGTANPSGGGWALEFLGTGPFVNSALGIGLP